MVFQEKDEASKIIDKRYLVAGQVVLKIFKGNVIILSRRSNNKAYSMKKVSFEENKHFNKKKVENFIKYHAKKTIMNNTIRNIQLTAVVFVLLATILGFILEVIEMFYNKKIDLADLLLLFIYIEVIGLVRSYWETRSVRITYPMLIAITALAKGYIILQDKNDDPASLSLYISGNFNSMR